MMPSTDMSNPLKRARTEIDVESAGTSGSSSPSTSNLTRHPQLWFSDGSIVLNAEKTIFRVHHSILSTHSTVFSDMLSIPQPLDQATIEGCPVVHLPDSATDVACLLKALYDPFYFANSNPDTRTPFQDVAGILRLSHKYDIPNFRRQAIQELKKLFPCTLPDFDAICHNGRQNSTTLMESIQLARSCNALELLPSILYFICGFSMSDMVKYFASLPRHELEICMVARDRLQVAQETQTVPWLFIFKPSEGCRSNKACELASFHNLSWIISNRHHAKCGTLEKIHKWDRVEKVFCGSCAAHFRSSHELAREKVWNELPGYFGLGTWEELRAAQG